VSKEEKFCPLIDKCDEKVDGAWYRYYCACYWSACPLYQKELVKLPKEWREEIEE